MVSRGPRLMLSSLHRRRSDKSTVADSCDPCDSLVAGHGFQRFASGGAVVLQSARRRARQTHDRPIRHNIDALPGDRRLNCCAQHVVFADVQSDGSMYPSLDILTSSPAAMVAPAVQRMTSAPSSGLISSAVLFRLVAMIPLQILRIDIQDGGKFPLGLFIHYARCRHSAVTGATVDVRRRRRVVPLIAPVRPPLVLPACHHGAGPQARRQVVLCAHLTPQ